MTHPQRREVRTPDPSKMDWDDVRRRQERTDYLIDRLRDALGRLDEAIDRATRKQ